jgi:hypothetical protein
VVLANDALGGCVCFALQSTGLCALDAVPPSCYAVSRRAEDAIGEQLILRDGLDGPSEPEIISG